MLFGHSVFEGENVKKGNGNLHVREQLREVGYTEKAIQDILNYYGSR